MCFTPQVEAPPHMGWLRTLYLPREPTGLCLSQPKPNRAPSCPFVQPVAEHSPLLLALSTCLSRGRIRPCPSSKFGHAPPRPPGA